tara:strand:+ start:327 stop:620 length:294 start_codon:yes stop_codon:yes gene_type:complete
MALNPHDNINTGRPLRPENNERPALRRIRCGAWVAGGLVAVRLARWPGGLAPCLAWLACCLILGAWLTLNIKVYQLEILNRGFYRSLIIQHLRHFKY